MADLRLEWIDPETLTPNPANWRRHPKAQKDALEAVISEVGWAGALLYNESTGRLIDGHLRQEISNDGPVPVLVGSWTEEQERLILATLDPIAALAEAESSALTALLESIETEDEQIMALLEALAEQEGIDLGDELVPDPGAQIDKAAELQEKWQVETGDLWEIGAHRLVCGDCTDGAVVERVMDGGQCQVLLFDPDWQDEYSPPAGYEQMLVFGDGQTLGKVLVVIESFPQWIFVWDCSACWYTPNRPLRRVKMCAWYGNLENYDFDGWHYGDAGKKRMVWNTRGKYTFHPDPRGKHLADLYDESLTRLHAQSMHSHSKPLEWITLLLGNCTIGDIYDPFLGSGTTILAAERLGRRAYGIELSPVITAVALERLAESGLQPVLVE